LDGTNSANEIAAPKPIGAAIAMATAVVTTVPTMRTPAPEPVMSGEYVPDHTKPGPKWANALAEPVAILTATVITTAAKTPAPSQRAGA
jgi:hypothetical protein